MLKLYSSKTKEFHDLKEVQLYSTLTKKFYSLDEKERVLAEEEKIRKQYAERQKRALARKEASKKAKIAKTDDISVKMYRNGQEIVDPAERVKALKQFMAEFDAFEKRLGLLFRLF